MSNRDVERIEYVQANGDIVTSSLTGTSFDLSLFRLRQR